MQRRPHLTRRQAVASLAASPWLLHGTAGRAQDAWPIKPIRYVVTFAAGGSTSVFSRLLADPVGKILGQSVWIDNRAGAGGMIGVDNVANHVTGEQLSSTLGLGLGLTHVPYKGASPAILDLLSGNIKLGILNIVDAMANINAGKFKPLLVAPRPLFGPSRACCCKRDCSSVRAQ